jgi:hypothetical protein
MIPVATAHSLEPNAIGCAVMQLSGVPLNSPSIPHRELLSDMGRLLLFVDHGHGVFFDRDAVLSDPSSSST